MDRELGGELPGGQGQRRLGRPARKKALGGAQVADPGLGQAERVDASRRVGVVHLDEQVPPVGVGDPADGLDDADAVVLIASTRGRDFLQRVARTVGQMSSSCLDKASGAAVGCGVRATWRCGEAARGRGCRCRPSFRGGCGVADLPAAARCRVKKAMSRSASRRGEGAVMTRRRRVTERPRALGCSQESLADQLGTDHTTAARRERGETALIRSHAISSASVLSWVAGIVRAVLTAVDVWQTKKTRPETGTEAAGVSPVDISGCRNF